MKRKLHWISFLHYLGIGVNDAGNDSDLRRFSLNQA